MTNCDCNERLLEIVFELQTLGQQLLHLRVKEAKGIAAVGFSLVHRHVGAPQQFIDGEFMPLEHRHANTAGIFVIAHLPV
jgi:hypothetical protein